MNKKKWIPVCEPFYAGKEEKYVLDAVRSKWISSRGEYVKKFEEEFSHYCGVRYGITTTSGTAALHLALLALGIKEGDEVIIPDFTMAAVVFAVLYCRAKPVFIDVEPDTWNIGAGKIEEKITGKTKAIIAVHTYGHPVDMSPVLALAKAYDLYVVEDVAEAHGAEYKGKKCGGLGDVGCFSFYANKIVTTGEGGMVVTSNAVLAERCRYYKNLCFALCGERDFIHDDLGYNYRMTNVQAAIGLAQLEHIDLLIEKRRRHARLYSQLLKITPGIQLPVEKAYARNVFWMYGVVIHPEEFGMTRDQLMADLRKRGIDSRCFFKPLHRQKFLKKRLAETAGNYPVTKVLSDNGVYLPSSAGLTEPEIQFICNVINRIRKKNHQKK